MLTVTFEITNIIFWVAIVLRQNRANEVLILRGQRRKHIRQGRRVCSFPLSSKTFSFKHHTSPLLVRSPPRAAAKAHWRNSTSEPTDDDFGDDHYLLLSRPVSRRRVLIFIRELFHFRLDECNAFALNQQMFLVQRFVRGDDESFLLR